MFKSIVTLTFVSVLSLIGFQQTHAMDACAMQPSHHMNPMSGHMNPMPGGWSPAAVDNPMVVKAACFAAETIQDGKLQCVLSAKQQVVSGMNYEMVLVMDNGHQWEARVYRNLNDQYSLTSAMQLQ